jgi:RimJ/RimL family protein N-acetyltransferase
VDPLAFRAVWRFPFVAAILRVVRFHFEGGQLSLAIFVMGSIDGSERLVYEPLTESHASDLSDALTDPRVYAYITGPHPATAVDLAVEFARMAAGPSGRYKNEKWWNFAVRVRGGKFIGRTQATLHDDLAEVAYVFGPLYWGRGYATEALTWLHTRIRETRQANSFWATVRPDNTRSIRLLERHRYGEVLQGWPRLFSYESGDRVYCKQDRLTSIWP